MLRGARALAAVESSREGRPDGGLEPFHRSTEALELERAEKWEQRVVAEAGQDDGRAVPEDCVGHIGGKLVEVQQPHGYPEPGHHRIPRGPAPNR